jgi:hypothetical protein
MKETPRPPNTATEKKLEEQIRHRAYQLYEARSRKDGNDLEDWLQAEIDITGNATPEGQPKADGYRVFRLLTSQATKRRPFHA